MRSNRIIERCLVAIAILVAFAVLRPVFTPGAARAQSHYEYQLVHMDVGDDPAAALSKLTKQG